MFTQRIGVAVLLAVPLFTACGQVKQAVISGAHTGVVSVLGAKAIEAAANVELTGNLTCNAPTKDTVECIGTTTTDLSVTLSGTVESFMPTKSGNVKGSFVGEVDDRRVLDTDCIGTC